MLHQATWHNNVDAIAELFEYPNCDIHLKTRGRRGGLTAKNVAEGKIFKSLEFLLGEKGEVVVFEPFSLEIENGNIPD